MRFIFFIGLCLCASSCATMLNSPRTTIAVRSKAGTKVTVDCVTQTVKRKGGLPFVVNRSSDSLLITLSRDTATREVWVKSRLSHTGYLNVLTLGLGFKKDRRSPERYSYPKRIWIPLEEQGNRYYTENPQRKGMLGIHFFIPLENGVYYRLSPVKSQRESLPFGFTLGASYGMRSNRYLSFEAGGSMNFNIGEQLNDTTMERPHWIAFFNVRKNHILGAFTLGYGLDFSHYHWETYNRVKTTTEQVILNRSVYNTTGVGPMLSAYLRMGQMIAVGMKYHTQLISYSDQLRFRYGHIVSLGVEFSFPTKRRYLYN